MKTKKISMLAVAFLVSFAAWAGERMKIWPDGKMPDAQPHQIGAMMDEAKAPGFVADEHRFPYLEWYDKPANPNGCCMILISGGGYGQLYDVKMVKIWSEKFTAAGFQCVNLVYRTPRPKGLPFYKSAWEDGQRAVRLVRADAAKRGYDRRRSASSACLPVPISPRCLRRAHLRRPTSAWTKSTTSPVTSPGRSRVRLHTV